MSLDLSKAIILVDGKQTSLEELNTALKVQRGKEIVSWQLGDHPEYDEIPENMKDEFYLAVADYVSEAITGEDEVEAVHYCWNKIHATV